ncbi:hypothetical protein [Reichenbachiella ulvae]|uniref:NnrS protein n=1 Tax=Reichenbachiella ulvae TaxID=2980104 RepID=A0ABT3CVZ7_9BACT|nr:hypothetical protein [Reichenbachiella ulvae]MCV9387882.1 hypothetical protein [Reichenbachiella ulvae]
MDLAIKSTGIRLKIAMANFLVVALLGCMLRYFLYRPFAGFDYGFVLHAHSHMAFLGWVFMALFAFILSAFASDENKPVYVRLFWILQGANLGMLFTFPFMGYALWSIVFSSIHAVTAMFFAIIFIKEMRKGEKKTAQLFVQWALILMILSNLAPFALGPVSATQGKGDLYYLLIYFYLHFQYNGWFTFALIGLLLRHLEQRGVDTQHRWARLGFKLKLIAIFPAFVLSALWTTPAMPWYMLAALAAMLQLVGLLFLLAFVIKEARQPIMEMAKSLRYLLLAGALALLVQHVLQALSAIPALVELAFARNIVIAYLHMVLIGFVTLFLFFNLHLQGYLRPSRSTHLGLLLFFGSFLLSEVILLAQPYIRASAWYLFLLALSQLLALLILFTQMKTQHQPT